MTDKETLKLALEAAYLAGFNASGEGWNGEYPFGDYSQQPEQDKNWYAERDDFIKQALAAPVQDTEAHYKGVVEGVQKLFDDKRAQPTHVQEPVAWPCHIIEADFSERTITLGMQCSDYKVGTGTHWLSTTPPAQRQWVDLTPQDLNEIFKVAITGEGAVHLALAKSKELNT
jgi:hypothetical protein